MQADPYTPWCAPPISCVRPHNRWMSMVWCGVELPSFPRTSRPNSRSTKLWSQPPPPTPQRCVPCLRGQRGAYTQYVPHGVGLKNAHGVPGVPGSHPRICVELDLTREDRCEAKRSARPGTNQLMVCAECSSQIKVRPLHALHAPVGRLHDGPSRLTKPKLVLRRNTAYYWSVTTLKENARFGIGGLCGPSDEKRSTTFRSLRK